MDDMSNHPARILVIDDSAEYLGFMEALLTAEGFCTEVARTAAEARERLATTAPDLVISDVRMPGFAPFGVLDLLHADEKTRAIPVLFCTGATQEVGEADDRLSLAGAEVLLKPFDIEDLLARIAHLLARAEPA